MRDRVIGLLCAGFVTAAWLSLWLFTGCANITSPPGGKKDTIAPVLLSVEPANRSLNIKPKKIEMRFDEFITVSDASKEVQISPLLTVDPQVTGLYKKVTIKLADTLLEDNTTYRISFGKSIKDLHEGNVFKNYTYTFSTCNYFDSLTLKGNVLVAATGLPDTSDVTVVLYNVTDIDSCIVRHKPKYVTHADKSGNFTFKGLPQRTFKIFAMRETNGNMFYDGPPELIAFNDSMVRTGDSVQIPIIMRLFREPDDTSIKKVDTVSVKKNLNKKNGDEAFKYVLNVDTTSPKKRTFDINYPVKLLFNRVPVINKARITLSYDSEGVAVPVQDSVIIDTTKPMMVQITTNWKQNVLYTLKLPKNFAKDTSGAEAQPGRYSFRTWKDEDYGKINIHLPGKYRDSIYLLQVTCDKDTIYQKPVTDTVIILAQLAPAKYSFRIIVDKNKNGKWDSGNLFGKLQPEYVIPYRDVLTLKAGWENDIDFEEKPPPVTNTKTDKDKKH